MRRIFLLALSLLVLLAVSRPARALAPSLILSWGASSPRGIAIDGYGHVYVDMDGYRIGKFSSVGVPLLSWQDMQQYFNTTFLAVDAAGFVYVSDTGNSRIRKFTADGALQTNIGSGGSCAGCLTRPSGIAIDAGGFVYVVDSGNNRVVKFTTAGVFVAKWGSAGTGDGQFASPLGIAVDWSGCVYVVDSGNNRIQKFTSTGTFVAKWGSAGTGDGQFSSPTGIASDPRSGELYVVDRGNYRIQEFTSTGDYELQWGSEGDGPMQFYAPYDVEVDLSGRIHVTDESMGVVKVFGWTPVPATGTTWGSLKTHYR